MNTLMGLNPSVRTLLDENFRCGETESIAAAEYIELLKLGREIDVEPLVTIVDHAMQKFRSKPEDSDSWLAPRIHAVLRLKRREAGDRRIWIYLNVVVRPEYVRWRWNADKAESIPAPLDRFIGEDSKNSFGRLWWAAELTRNGSDYVETTEILKNSRFAISWQHLDAMHHRPTAIALARFWREFNNGAGLTDWQSQRLAKAFNLRLATLSLDAVSANDSIDARAIDEWCKENVDEGKYLGNLPNGPDEEQVPESSIKNAYEVLARLANDIDLASMRKPRSKSGQKLHSEELVDTTADE